MKLSKNKIKKILSDDVLIYAHRRNLWKNGITPKFKISDEVMEFLLFLESKNAMYDFLEHFQKYNPDNYTTIAEYFEDKQQKYYLTGAFYWDVKGDNYIWKHLNNSWIKQIKK